ncbi:MAG: TlpA family protein disulfide reductase [Tannerellaceae bacterium]|nr:TlpA family protein disulfide reductase [Tannerellaceae bacterium]
MIADSQKKAFRMQEEANATGNPDLQTEGVKMMNDSYVLVRTLMELYSEFIKKNPDKAFSAMLVRFDSGLENNINALQQQLAAFTPEVQSSYAGQEVKRMIESVLATQVGGTAPGFSLLSENGEVIKLSDFRGQYMIIDFWGSWCGPCRQIAPQLVEFYNGIKDNENIVMVGISCWEQDEKEWRKAIEEDGLAWLQLIDGKGSQSAAGAYVIKIVPQTFLISPEGTILLRDHPAQVLPEIKRMLEI